MKILTKIFSLWLIALTLLGSCKQSVLKERIRTHRLGLHKLVT